MDASRVFLLAIAAGLLVLSTLFVLPYLQFFLLAVLLAYVLTPVQRRLARQTSPRIAAGLLTAGASVAVVVPLVVVLRAVLSDATALFDAVREGDVGLGAVEAAVAAATGFEVDVGAELRSLAGDVGSGAFGEVLGAFGAITHVAIGLGLTVFLLYYFLKDGDDFLTWLRWIVPLSNRVIDELFAAVDGITRAVLAGHVLVAIVQGAIAGLGLVATGVPNALFWTAVMIVLALLPIVGSFIVWGPASAYLFLTGDPVPAAGLFVYGTIVVGVSDDYLRPIVVDRYARVSPAVIVLGVVGGLGVLGFVGIFLGPVVIGALRATLDVYREEYQPVARA